jgi:hypothetical protein
MILKISEQVFNDAKDYTIVHNNKHILYVGSFIATKILGKLSTHICVRSYNYRLLQAISNNIMRFRCAIVSLCVHVIFSLLLQFKQFLHLP